MTVAIIKSAENKLQLAQDLLGRVVEQNDKFPGAGATVSDLSQAKTLLQDMVVILPDLTSQVSAGAASDQDSAPVKEAQQAFNKAASLISSIYDDIREAHAALADGTTQSQSIQQAEIHLKRLVKHCHQAREHLLMDRDVAS
jgi:small-conductance mechanosensitive channel